MADRTVPLVLAGLSRAAAEAAGGPLHGTRAQPGLFAATAAGKQAARRCLDEGLLRVVEPAPRGRDLCAVTDRGLEFVLDHAGARAVLEDFIRVLDGRQAQAAELLAEARRMQAGLDALRANAERVLLHLQRQAQPADAWEAAVLDYLARRSAAGDCPLPELYRQACLAEPGLTVGRFHDGLRRLCEQQRLYLHPWTAPLYDLPEPACALLAGHEVAYYASIRSPAASR
jgi:hypothetical protein